jgi:hypothetical protein
MLIVIFHVLHIYFVCQENMYILQLLQFILITHELWHFEKNVVLDMLTK